MKRAAFCLLVFSIRWIYSYLFEKARRSVWPQHHMCPLALQFLVFLDGGTQCIVNHVWLSQQWVITLQKEWREWGRRGRDGPKPDLLQRFLQAGMQFALQSPGFYLLNNHAPHWGLVPQKKRHRKRQEKKSQEAKDKNTGQQNWELIWRFVRVCVFVTERLTQFLKPSVWFLNLATENFGLKGCEILS